MSGFTEQDEVAARLITLGYAQKGLHLAGQVHWSAVTGGVAKIRIHRRGTKGWVVTWKDGDQWYCRAVVEVGDTPLYLVAPESRQLFDEPEVSINLRRQVQLLESFEGVARRLTENGPALVGVLLKEVGTVIDNVSGLAFMWLSQRPWTKGCGWDWWRIAARDIEAAMEARRLPDRERWLARALVTLAFERVLGKLRED